MKKRIVYTTVSLESGGSQVYFLNLLRSYDKSKYRVYVIIPSEGLYFEEVKTLTNDIFFIDFRENFFSISIAFRRIIKTIQPDIIYSHLVKSSFLSVIASIGLNVKHLSNLHSEYNLTIIPSVHKLILYRITIFFIQYFVQFIAVSEYMKKQLISYGIAESRINVIYNGIDIKKVENNQNTCDEFIVTYVGRLTIEKGLLTILEIAKKMHQVQFRIVGEGLLRKQLESEVKTNKINNVHLSGFRRDVAKILRESTILLLPSKSESFGLVVAEAMACSLPVIASNIGGIPELVVEGKGGFLCNVDDIDCFVEHIQYLKDNPHLREEFGAFNRKRFEDNFTLKEMIETLEKKYDSL